jgi:hypothetical protein
LSLYNFFDHGRRKTRGTIAHNRRGVSTFFAPGCRKQTVEV